MKRMLAMLLAVLMVFGMLPAQAFATETVPEETEAVMETEATEPTVGETQAETVAETEAEIVEETEAETTAPETVTEETMEATEETTEVTEETAADVSEETTVETVAETVTEETVVVTDEAASGAVTEEEIPAPVLTYRVLKETEEGWTLEDWDNTANGGLYGEDELTFAPGEYWLAFYLNAWNAETGTWDYTPVHVEFGEYLTGELLVEGGHTFLPDAEDSGFYYHVVISETDGQQTASIAYEYEGVEEAKEVGLSAIEELEWETTESIQDDIELTDILISDNASYVSASAARRDVINPNGIDGQAIVNKAREWMNKSPKPLRYDGTNFNSRTGFTSPPSFDCSGFIFRVCYDVGLTSTHKPYDFSKQDSHGNYYITSDTHNQKLYGESLTAAVNDYKQTGSVAGFHAGDLLFLDYDGDNVTDHVGIYTSDGKVIHSSSSNSLVETPLSQGGWYKKTMGAWLYEAVRLVPLCSHPKYVDNGICSTCKQKFNWTLDTSTAGVYSVVKDFTPRLGGPYDADTKDTSKTFIAGSKVTVFGSLKNAYGNLWYQIGYGDGKVGYVFHEYLKEYSDPLIVTYNANGGSGAPGNQTKVYGSTLTLSSTKPTRAGYTFLGWSTSSTATSATYAAGGSYTVNASATLYAVWKKHTCQKGNYLWQWTAHPHYSCYSCSICGAEMAAYDEPNYWSSCATCNQNHVCDKGNYLWQWTDHPHYSCYSCAICGEEMAAYDEPNYWDTCATCNPANISCSSASVTLKVGESKTINITKSGNYAGNWTFSRALGNSNVRTLWGNWNGDTCPITITGLAAGTTVMNVQLIDADTDETLDTVTVIITITTDDYVVTFDPDNGQSPTTVTVKPGGTATVPSEIPYELGCTFKEWMWIGTDNSSLRLRPGEVFAVSGNMTFRPMWSYIDIGDVTGSAAGSVTPIYKNAHNFIWFTPSVTTNYQICSTSTTSTFQSTLYVLDNDNRILAKDTSSAAGDQVSVECALTAGNTYYISFVGLGSQSETIPFMINRGFKVSYDGNGGSGEPSDTYFYYGEWTEISSTVPTRAGYRFLGWSTSKTATTAQYTPAKEVEFTQDTTLYAVWEKTDDIVYGDVNYDGALNTNDVIIYSKYVQLGTIPNYYNEQDFMLRADLDRDGAITENDLDYLRSLIVGNYTQEDMHGAYTGISVTSYPKTTYIAGEKLDTNGLAITLVYGAQKYKITEDLTVTGFDSNKVGTQTLTVKYHQFTTTYNVTVQAAHKHSYTATVVKPTCTEKGYTQYNCSCGDSYKDNYVNALGHTEVTVKGTAATCTQAGKTDGKKCSVCGTVTVAQQTINKTGHTEVTVKGTAATCTEAGKTDGKKCSVCGTVTVAQQTINKTGHTEVTVKGTAATCTEAGKTDGKKCSVCGTVTVAQQTINKTGHTEVTVKGKAATCTEAGKTDGKQCSVCGTVTVKQKTIEAKGHAYTDDKDATCDVCGAEREIAVASVPMHRMYDPNSGEHFYTGSEVERDFLVSAGWHYEGVGFNFPEEGKPVYRLYEPVYGEHLHTMDEAERAKLISWGWNDEGVAFNSAGEDEVPQYRLRNPNAKRGGYHFTGSAQERQDLIDVGWIYEGIGWYSCLE